MAASQVRCLSRSASQCGEHPVELEGKSIIVTGASSGIGAAAARLFAAAGAKVVMAARNAEALQAGAEEIATAGGDAAFLALDVRDAGHAEALVEFALNRFG